ncbi:membrane integrity-associated transporter subunit PqiC [Undibacterium seohonense]|uniref:Membrane integrity-associated transporter subunit PqiC n=1 Tax=Undibacterium seohonense TaxID=1344950 RepID=A0ABR6X5E7_9BURK|nr:ABC-type transport auxiliary lipoprotein family protein [Undibacterium seohonense]MBC3808086.1 membrane integrity-associated transporter subunit PqiC [Undibacterium seohonense]
MIFQSIATSYLRYLFGLSTVCLLSSCSVLTANKVDHISVYSLGNAQPTTEPERQENSIDTLRNPETPTIILSMPRAAAGFETKQIAYVRLAFQLEYFSLNQWIAPPSAMLLPLMSHALERTGDFNAVLQSPSRASGQLRLDLEIIRLQQEFFKSPSQVHFTLRAHLIDTASRRVIAWQEFDAAVAAPSEDPYGGVVAANQVVRLLVEQVADFCVRTQQQQSQLKAPQQVSFPTPEKH